MIMVLNSTMKYLILSLLFVATSCFNTGMDDDYSSIDHEIKPYVDQFVIEAHKRGIEINTQYLKIGFGDPGDCAGKTYYRNAIIIIDRNTPNWKNAKQNTVWHELGHLYLNRGHKDCTLDDGTACSIMNSGIKTPKINDSNRDYYLNELFTR
jgi:hypothetical protein